MAIEKSSSTPVDHRRKILITGAGGLLGRHATRWFADRYDVIAARHEDVDITDARTVGQWITEHRPDLIINCAAFSNVDACEREPARAFAVNAEGAYNLALAAHRVGAELVHFSTDYVFDGRKRTPYTIEDDPRPINVYGQSKLEGEKFVRRALSRHYIVRIARLFGRGGRNFASALLDLARRQGRLLAIVDEIGSPTYVMDLIERLDEIIRWGPYGTYHVTNEGACSWYEFALTALRLAGLRGVVIEKVNSADLNRPARRPHYTALRCLVSERLGWTPLRPWSEAFAAFIHERDEQTG